MSLALGVDTGGTYTDAVLIKDETKVIASAKSLTTREDLAIGIGQAVGAVLSQSGAHPSQITLASLSTTLATNALIEGHGERVGLILIGFTEKDMQRQGLAKALGDDPYIVLKGGHTHAGGEAAPLDEGRLADWLTQQHSTVTGFAVAAQFATRNPAHEIRTMEIIAQISGHPVSASHHLSAKLNGPKRATTALLNARLIGMIDRLISRAQDQFASLGITAPMMVVQGDGALISANYARQRPIETILSGPAASIVGARWMTGATDALVSDIGGTTTDIALLRGGKPAIDPQGARVGPFRTMVEAVAMRTFGLGGDSHVHMIRDGIETTLRLGPRRVLPVSLMAEMNPDVVLSTLGAQLRTETPNEHAGRFVVAVPRVGTTGLRDIEKAVLDRIGDQIRPVGDILTSRLDGTALDRLAARGVVQMSGVTPSDASHVLGHCDTWNVQAATQALTLFARHKTGTGAPLAPDAATLAQMITSQMTQQTAQALLQSALSEEQADFGVDPAGLADHILLDRGLDHHAGVLRIEAGLNVPVIGLGASASLYYPAVGKRLGCQAITPDHADVANAIGAVVGRVTLRRSGTVTSPSEGLFRVHLSDGPKDFTTADDALTHLVDALKADAVRAAQAAGAGAGDVQIDINHDIRTATLDAREIFVEAEITVEASGRPRIAS